MTTPKITRSTLIWASGMALLLGGIAAVAVSGLTRSPSAPAGDVMGGAAEGGGPIQEQPRPDRPALPTDRPGTGAHTLSGGVYDVAGATVAGAVITAEIELGPGTDSLASEPGLSTSPAVVAVSKADGSFALVGLDAGRYRLTIEGEAIFTAEVRFVDVPADGMRLVVARKVDVRGFVVDDATGDPIADIEVRLVAEGDPTAHVATADENGEFVFEQLPEAVFTVWAAAQERAAPAVTARRLGAGPFDTVELRVGPAAIVSGRVIDATTGRGVSAAVRLQAVDGAEPARYGRSGADGAFHVEGVPETRWSADAFSPGYVATEAIEFDVGGRFVPTIELQPGAVVTGRVIDLGGSPIAGAVVSLRSEDIDGDPVSIDEQWQIAQEHTFSGRGGRATSTADDPRFVPIGELGVLLGPIPFPPPPGAATVRIASIIDDEAAASGDPDAPPTLAVDPDMQSMYVTDAQGQFAVVGAPAGTYRVAVAHADYAPFVGTRARTLALGQRVDGLEIVLKPGVAIAGTVTNQRGEVVVGATIIADVPGDPLSRIQAVTGTDGRYELGAISTNISLRVTAVDHGDAVRRILIGAPSLTRVERTEDFVLIAADATLAGRVVDGSGFPVREAVVTIVSDDRTAADKSAVTDDAGLFEIPRLAPGTWDIEVDHLGFPAIVTTASTERNAAITLPFGGGVDLEVRDAHTRSALAGALISGVGPHGAERSSAAGDDGTVELTPLARGTWTLTITAPGYVTNTHTVDVPAGTRPRALTIRDVQIELERGAHLTGTVRDDYGMRVRGATVTVGTLETTSDEEGAFELRDVPTGDAVTITATRNGATGSVTVNLAPGDELVTLDITVE